MNPQFNWKFFLSKEKESVYFKNILNFISQRKKLGIMIYPKSSDIFNVFRFTEFNSIKAVIIGQDPYHGPNQAHGLAFSVPLGIPLPPSLKNIYKELKSDIDDFVVPKHGCLISWAKSGVFLLNSILTVEKGKSCSHANIGWEQFTNKIIYLLNTYHKNIVFLLWGNYAKTKIKLIDHKKHYILVSSHPSPMSAHYGFLGCRHFSKVNNFLNQHNKQIINWNL